jgi:hypothetical protein
MTCLCRHRGEAEVELQPICNLGAWRGRVVSTMLRLLYHLERPTIQEAGWTLWPVCVRFHLQTIQPVASHYSQIWYAGNHFRTYLNQLSRPKDGSNTFAPTWTNWADLRMEAILSHLPEPTESTWGWKQYFPRNVRTNKAHYLMWKSKRRPSLEQDLPWNCEH